MKPENLIAGSFSQSRKRGRRLRTCVFTFGLAGALVAPIIVSPARAAGRPQAQEKQPLGSLNTTGEVSVNGSPVSGESTIFTGDTLSTGAAGTAIFTMSGKGTLKIAPQTHVVFSGDQRFTAELKSGSAVIDSMYGPNGVTLRVASVVVIPSVQDRPTSAKVQLQPDGSFLVTCTDGNISTLPLQGTSGQLLEAGQSVTVSPEGELSAKKEPTPPPGTGGAAPSGPSTSKGNATRWALIGLGGAGAGIAAAVLAHGGKHSVSPSSP